MFDYHSAMAHSQDRKERMIRAAHAARLVAKQPRRSRIRSTRLLMGNLLIALGNRLTAPYEAARDALNEAGTPQESLHYDRTQYQVETAAQR